MRKRQVKKFCILILSIVSVASDMTLNTDWEGHYSTIHKCGISADIYHVDGKIDFVNMYSSSSAPTIMLKGSINGCKYDIYLEYGVTQEVFEAQIINSGFEIVEVKATEAKPK